MEKYQIAILGERSAIQGFQALGVSAFGLSVENAEATLEQVVESGKYAIVFISEDWMDKLGKKAVEYSELPLPAIVSVPSPLGSSGAAFRNLKRIVERAVGSDIFKD